MENNSKQAVLSIVGIAILVIAVVGVSFAFFTYSKQGTKNNVITTGKIEFAYNETNNLSLTNQFPSTDEEGYEENQSKTFNFNVSGTIPETADSITYTVTAVAGDVVYDDMGTPADTEDDVAKTRMADADINIYVTSSNGGTVLGGYDTNADGEIGAVAGNSAEGFDIAEGTITNSGDKEQHDYSLTMWVNDSVHISDTDATVKVDGEDVTVKYCAHDYVAEHTDPETGKLVPEYGCKLNLPTYSKLYYSLKVNVEAHD